MTEDQRTASNEAEEVSPLDRRRSKMQTTKAAAATAAERAEALDQQLAVNAERHSGYEADLQTTLDRVAALKKTIKASGKERVGLLGQRKQARKVSAKAQDRAGRAEGKYDGAVLSDLVRREKDNDLSAHAEQSSGPRSAKTVAAAAAPEARESAQPAAGADASVPATPEPTQGAAARTAARTTAARARTATPRTPASRTRSPRTTPAQSAEPAGASEDPKPDA